MKKKEKKSKVVGFLLSVRRQEIGMSQHSNAMNKNKKIILSVRMREIQGNQRLNAERKKIGFMVRTPLCSVSTHRSLKN